MEKFATTTPVTAVVNLPAGRVQVIAADRADATVEVLPAESGRGRDVRTAEQTAVGFQDGVLRIDTVPGGRLVGAGAVEVTLQVPVGSRIEVTSDSTEFRAVGRLGDVVVGGAYRRIKIDEADSVRLTAVDGDVEVGRLNGPAEISTSRGAIRIAEAVRGAVVLRTESGDIEVAAAAGASAALDAGTGHGRISNSLRNDGATVLDIGATTSYGDIAARSL